MRVSTFFIMFVIVILSLSAQASLGIYATTDKSVYQLGETVNITITVSNFGSTVETLMGGGTYLMEDGSGGIISTDYIIDDTYIWSDWYKVINGSGLMWMREFQPGETDSWVMSHGTHQMQDYPLDVGSHSVVGKAGFTLFSDPVIFYVTPEPATLSLLAFGGLLLRKRK